MKKILARISAISACLLWASACATLGGKSQDAVPPAWTQQPTRTVDNGYIIYVGTGEDATVERAQFKASGMALQDLVNECSLAPKATRTEDSFEQRDGSGHAYKTWVRISVQYEDCQDAQKAIEPDQIRKVANAQLSQELKRYQQMIDEPQPPLLAGDSDTGGLNPALGNTSPPPQTSVQVVAVRDYGSFFWARQQIAYTKQIVILSPPGAYAPGSLQTTYFIRQMTPAQAAVTQYATQNPEVRTWHQSYSGSPVRQQMVEQRAMTQPVHGGGGQRFRSAGRYGARSGTPAFNGRKRRRRWGEGR